MACREAPRARSVVSETNVHLELVNGLDEEVVIEWIDFAGARVLYRRLSPGGSYVQQTYVTHPWVVTTARSGRCVMLFVPELGGAQTLRIELD